MGRTISLFIALSLFSFSAFADECSIRVDQQRYFVFLGNQVAKSFLHDYPEQAAMYRDELIDADICTRAANLPACNIKASAGKLYIWVGNRIIKSTKSVSIAKSFRDRLTVAEICD